MDVEHVPLNDSAIYKLRSMEHRPTLDIVEGEILGYWCSNCQQSDETLEQIIHEPGCELSGRHGRRRYNDDHGPHDTRESGELRSDTFFTLLNWGTEDESLRVKHREYVAVRCDECGNLDETLWEIVHDAACNLAGPKFGPLVERI